MTVVPLDADYDELLRSATRRARVRLVGPPDRHFPRLVRLLAGAARDLFAQRNDPDLLRLDNRAVANELVAWLALHHPDERPRPLPLFLAVGRAIELALEEVAARVPQAPTVTDDTALTTLFEVCGQPQAFLKQTAEARRRTAPGDRPFLQARLLRRFAGRTAAETADLLSPTDPEMDAAKVEHLVNVLDVHLTDAALARPTTPG